jgi:antirestriction protein ArdC
MEKSSNRFNAAKVIFDTIVENLENNTAIWSKPWVACEVPCNAVSKKSYRGFNAFILNIRTSIHGWKTNRYMTFKQIKDCGGMVKRGEHSAMIVFAEKKMAYKKDSDGNYIKDENGKPTFSNNRFIFLSKYYNVFNIDQCEGLPDSMYKTESFDTDIDINGESTLKKYADCPKIKHESGDRAAYSLVGDYIVMPQMNQFKNSNGYYSTLFHECTHSTGAKNRLNRDMSGRFGDESYAKEELIAEIGSAILMNASGLNVEIEDNAAYCKSWLKAIKEMKESALMGIFNKAWTAAEYIQGRRYE